MTEGERELVRFENIDGVESSRSTIRRSTRCRRAFPTVSSPRSTAATLIPRQGDVLIGAGRSFIAGADIRPAGRRGRRTLGVITT
jgi:hypothetical protein